MKKKARKMGGPWLPPGGPNKGGERGRAAPVTPADLSASQLTILAELLMRNGGSAVEKCVVLFAIDGACPDLLARRLRAVGGVFACPVCGKWRRVDHETDGQCSFCWLEAAIGDCPVLIGLDQQGHVPRVEAMLQAGRTWEEVGLAIGWDATTARDHYDRRPDALYHCPACRTWKRKPSRVAEGTWCQACVNGVVNDALAVRV